MSADIAITVIMPVRNEAAHIEACLDTVLAQDYPHERVEVLVVDGMSDDGTREIVERMAERYERLRLLDNLERIVPPAMNIGIRAARGQTIVRIDGHCRVPVNYLSTLARLLEAHPEAECVGGYWINEPADTPWGPAIAHAVGTRLGAGSAHYRTGDFAGYVDTLAFGAYRRSVFDRVGLFDPRLVRNQDDELNFRITDSGGKIFLSREIYSTYYPRGELRGLWRQYYQYGYYKVAVIARFGRPASPRHLAPPLLAGGLIVGAMAALLVAPLRGLYVFGLLSYLLLLSIGGLRAAAEKGQTDLRWRVPVVLLVLHLAYGIGFWRGLFAFGWPFGRRKIEMMPPGIKT